MPRMPRAGASVLIAALWVSGFAGAGLTAREAAAAGEDPAARAASQPSQGEFVPLKTLPQQDELPAAPLLVTAYGFVWAVLLVYVWTIWRRLMKVEREVQQLSSRVSETAARR